MHHKTFTRHGSEASLGIMMTLAHEQLDQLFYEADSELRAETGPALLLTRYITAIRAHIDLEETVLTPMFSGAQPEYANSPMAVMHVEHEQILRQVDLIEHLLQDLETNRSDLRAWMALLAASLAAHEFREETMVFPRWDRQGKALPNSAQFLQWLDGQLTQTVRWRSYELTR